MIHTYVCVSYMYFTVFYIVGWFSHIMLCQTNTFSFSQIDAPSGSQRLVKSLGAAAVQSKPCGQCTAVHWPLAHSRHS